MNTSPNFSPTLLKTAWRYLIRHPWQTVLMVVGVMIGVAVMVAIDLANVSAGRAFTLSTEAVVGKTTHQVIGGPEGVPEEIYLDLRQRGISSAAAPVISEYISSPQLGDQPFQLLGVDPFVEAPFRDYLVSSSNIPLEGLTKFLTEPGAVLISTDTADRFGLSIGDSIKIEFAGFLKEGRIAGLVSPEDRISRRALDAIIITDISTAQEFTGRLGTIDWIDLILPESDPAALTQIEGSLPAGIRIVPVAARVGTVNEMTAAFRVNLTAMSLLALVVGMFLIYNTMTFSVVTRRPLFGTLRSLGVTRREIFSLVLGEALLVGALSTTLGILLGIALGQGALRLVTRTINDLYFVVTVQGVEVPASSLVKGTLVGLLSTLISAAIPAWEAASVSPRDAMIRSNLEAKTRRIVIYAALTGLFVTAAGAGLLAVPGSDLTLSFLGTFATIIGFALLTPLATMGLMRLVTPLTGRLWGPLGRMAPREVVNTLSRTGIAVASLMVAVSVIIGVSLMVSSFRFTVVTWLSQSLQGDVYISPPSLNATQNAGLLSPEALEIIRSWPGIARVDTVRSVAIDSPNGPIQVAAVDNPDTSVERIYLSADGPPEVIAERMSDGGILVSEPLANRLDLAGVGGSLTLITNRGARDFPVAGIYYDYASSQGTVLMDQAIYREFWEDTGITAAALRLEPEVNVDETVRALQTALTPYQQLLIRPNQALREEVLEVFDRTFDITTALQVLATVVAFIGVLSALFSLQLEKGRQLGILRAIGLSVRQLWQLVLMETGLMGLVAGLLSLPTGYVLSWILIFIINRRSFGWTLQMQVEPEPFLQALLIALTAALLAGIYPAFRISQKITADAIRFE